MSERTASAMMIILLLMSILTIVSSIQTVEAEPRTWTVDDDGPADFHSIQEAINASSHGDTIFVFNGTYRENIVVDKMLCLVGESNEATVLERNEFRDVVKVLSNNVSIRNFMIRPHGDRLKAVAVDRSNYIIITNNRLELAHGSDLLDGIFLDHSKGNIIKFNYISDPRWCPRSRGIILNHANNNLIAANRIDGGQAISLWDSSYNKISHNNITRSWPTGMTFDSVTGHVGTRNNVIRANDISNSSFSSVAIVMQTWNIRDNLIYHNSFMEDVFVPAGQPNRWDNGYPSGGNYWSGYNGTDFYNGPYQNKTGSDGIGDASYIFGDCIDHYPLMHPRAHSPDLHMDQTPLYSEDIMFSNTNPDPGENVTIYATIYNLGEAEAQNITVIFYINDVQIGLPQTILLIPIGENVTVSTEWIASQIGSYVVRVVIDAPFESEKNNNMATRAMIVGRRDVSIIDVAISETFVVQGCSVNITVIVENQGDFDENLSVTAYADLDTITIGDETIIGIMNVTLPSRQTDSINFTWKTTKVTPGNYTISAVADIVPGETNTTDNTYIDGAIDIRAHEATVDITPNTLNLRSKAGYVTSFIELPEGYNISDIDTSTILLNDTIPIDPDAPMDIGDYDNDTLPDLMVKFNRAEVISYILANVNTTKFAEERFMTITLTITGILYDGTAFEGSDIIAIMLHMPRGT